MLHMFDVMIKPILVYGSDAWGTNKATHLAVDKAFLHFARCILCVKATTSNAVVFGETGHLPPSTSNLVTGHQTIRRDIASKDTLSHFDCHLSSTTRRRISYTGKTVLNTPRSRKLQELFRR